MKYQCPNGGKGGGKGYGGKGYGGGQWNENASYPSSWGGKGNVSVASIGDEISFGDVQHQETTITVRCKANQKERLKEILMNAEKPVSIDVDKPNPSVDRQVGASPGTKATLSRLEIACQSILSTQDATKAGMSSLASTVSTLNTTALVMQQKLASFETDVKKKMKGKGVPLVEFEELCRDAAMKEKTKEIEESMKKRKASASAEVSDASEEEARETGLGDEFRSEDDELGDTKRTIENWIQYKWKADLKGLKEVAEELGFEWMNYRKKKDSIVRFVDLAYAEHWSIPEADRDSDEGDCDLIQYLEAISAHFSQELGMLYGLGKRKVGGVDGVVDGQHPMEVAERIEFLIDFMGLIRMMLVLFRPSNRQQSLLAKEMWEDLQWCAWRTCISPADSSYDSGYGDIYVITGELDAGEYLGSTWTFRLRRMQHWREGGRPKVSSQQSREGGNIKDDVLRRRQYQKAMRQRVYRMMHARGRESVSMIAVKRVPIRLRDTKGWDKSAIRVEKERCKKVIEKVEHNLARRIASKLNERGMKRGAIKNANAMRPGLKVRTKTKVRDVVEMDRKAVEKSVENRVRTRSKLLSKFRLLGEERFTVDMTQVLDVIRRGDSVEAVIGTEGATDWQLVRKVYGNTRVKCNGEESMTVNEWTKLWERGRFEGKQVSLRVEVLVRKPKDGNSMKSQIANMKDAVRWSRGKGIKNGVPVLQKLEEWEKVLHLVPGFIRGLVRSKVRWAIKKQGGEVVPTRVVLRIPAGVTVRRTDIRLWWYKMIETEKSECSRSVVQRWKEALEITMGSAKTIESRLVNASRKCAEVEFNQGGVESKCVCGDQAELVAIMKEKHGAVWERHGHIHMAADDVPWKVRGVGGVNVKSEMKGGERNLKMEFWESMREVVRKAKVSGSSTVWLQSAEQYLEVRENVKIIDDRFSVGAVAEFKRLADRGVGLVRTVLDRDAGRLWLTCPELHAEFGREHFKYAEDKDDWEEWVSDCGDRPQYWKVPETEEVILKEWKKVYQRVNKEKCAGRWREWDPGGRMMQARWQYKKKDVSKIRAIFNGKNDPAVREMEVAAKCVGLIKKSVGALAV